MAKLIYSAITSLDGYIADEDGNFDLAAPDEELHTFINDLERPIGTYLHGRRLYEVMAFWETVPTTADQPAISRDYAEIWQAADKIVYSPSLETVSSVRTWMERAFRCPCRPGADLSVGGSDLAGQAIRTGWSMSGSSSSPPSWWAAATRPSRATSTAAWNSSINAASAMGWCTSAIAQCRDGDAAPIGTARRHRAETVAGPWLSVDRHIGH